MAGCSDTVVVVVLLLLVLAETENVPPCLAETETENDGCTSHCMFLSCWLQDRDRWKQPPKASSPSLESCSRVRALLMYCSAWCEWGVVCIVWKGLRRSGGGLCESWSDSACQTQGIVKLNSPQKDSGRELATFLPKKT